MSLLQYRAELELVRHVVHCNDHHQLHPRSFFFSVTCSGMLLATAW